MTYSKLEDLIEEAGYNPVALWRMMDIVEEQTGKYPRWDDQVADWILKNFGYEGRSNG